MQRTPAVACRGRRAASPLVGCAAQFLLHACAYVCAASVSAREESGSCGGIDVLPCPAIVTRMVMMVWRTGRRSLLRTCLQEGGVSARIWRARAVR